MAGNVFAAFFLQHFYFPELLRAQRPRRAKSAPPYGMPPLCKIAAASLPRRVQDPSPVRASFASRIFSLSCASLLENTQPQ